MRYELQELYSVLKEDLLTVLDNFVAHAGHLENFDEGWRVFMRQYLSSVQHIVGQQSLIRTSKVADTASVPTSFLEELEALRAKVEELNDEVRLTYQARIPELTGHSERLYVQS